MYTPLVARIPVTMRISPRLLEQVDAYLVATGEARTAFTERAWEVMLKMETRTQGPTVAVARAHLAQRAEMEGRKHAPTARERRPHLPTCRCRECSA